MTDFALMRFLFNGVFILSLIEGMLCCITSGQGRLSCKQKEGTSICGDVTTLKVVQIVFRHGDRAPIFAYPTDPYRNSIEDIWSVKAGGLTKVIQAEQAGVKQLQETGQYFRKRYKGFISSSYSENEIYITSSDVDRSISSAQAFLNGLFTDDVLGFSVAPIHGIPSEKDNKIHFSSKHLKCPSYDQEIQKLNNSLAKIYNNDDKVFFDYLSTSTGTTIYDALQVYKLYDTLFIQDLYNLELPEWTKSVYPEPLLSIAHNATVVSLKSKKLTKLRGGPLLSLMLRRLRAKKNIEIVKSVKHEEMVKLNDQRTKMYLYAGHESTIVALQAALGVLQNHIPPYASSFIMELHSQPIGMCGREYIQIFYRNDTEEPYLLEIPGCKHPCYLETLLKSKKDVLVANQKEWDAECHQLDDNFWLYLFYEFESECNCEKAYAFHNLNHGVKLVAKKLKDNIVKYIEYAYFLFDTSY